ncbi:MAG: hypothetical protein ACOC34_06490 [Thermotogota bacterium]
MILWFAFGSLFALRFDIGVGAEKIEHTVPFLHFNLNTRYLVFENDFTYVHEFGMIDTIGLFLKLNSEITPKFGISTCWGYNQHEGLFFEKNGLIINAGFYYFLEQYAIGFKVGEYIGFDGRISELPIIKFSCTIKIGEW